MATRKTATAVTLQETWPYVSPAQVEFLPSTFCLGDQLMRDICVAKNVVAQMSEPGLSAARRFEQDQLQKMDDFMFENTHRRFQSITAIYPAHRHLPYNILKCLEYQCCR